MCREFCGAFSREAIDVSSETRSKTISLKPYIVVAVEEAVKEKDLVSIHNT